MCRVLTAVLNDRMDPRKDTPVRNMAGHTVFYRRLPVFYPIIRPFFPGRAE